MRVGLNPLTDVPDQTLSSSKIANGAKRDVGIIT
jgi:hypothetical protein